MANSLSKERHSQEIVEGPSDIFVKNGPLSLAASNIKRQSVEVMAFFTAPRQELAWLISLKICAVPLVLSLESRNMHCLTSDRL